MTSIIKVDQIQTAAGAASTADGLGVNITSTSMPTGAVLGVAQTTTTAKTDLNNANIKVMEVSLTSQQASSNFLVEIVTSVGGKVGGGNADIDIALGCGWRAGASSSTANDYSGLGYGFTRQNAGPTNGSWYSEDASYHGGSYNRYMQRPFSFKKLFSPAVAAGTVLYVSYWASSDNAMTVGGNEGINFTDCGMVQTITLTEIAG